MQQVGRWLKSSRIACVIASAVLASLLREGLIPPDWVEVASWVSGALLALPARLDGWFGYVAVHRSSLVPPSPPTSGPTVPPEEDRHG